MTPHPTKSSFVIAVSGWLFGAETFSPLQRLLGREWTVIALDGLPAGASAPADPTLDAVLQNREDCILAGWSLGAQRCLAAALQRPALARAMVLLAPTARLSADGMAYPGVEPAVLRAMRRRLRRDPHGCTRDFLAACHLPAKPDTASLTAAAAAAGRRWTLGDMEAGLARLTDTDLRAELHDLTLPVRILQGQADAVVPPAQGAWLAHALPRAKLQTFDGRGHLPDGAMWRAVANAIREFR